MQHPQSFVDHLPKQKSDHKPLLLRTTPHVSARLQKPFRFLSSWILDNQFSEAVKASWHPSNSFLEGKMEFTQAVSEWNKNHFGNIFIRKRKLLNRLCGIQKTL